MAARVTTVGDLTIRRRPKSKASIRRLFLLTCWLPREWVVADALPPVNHPRYKWQPPRSGPIWTAFCMWWKMQTSQPNRRSVAWRGFHAGYMIRWYRKVADRG